jgi:hypothetical protein
MRVNRQIELRRAERGTSSTLGRLTLKWTLPDPIAVSLSHGTLDGSLFGMTVSVESVARWRLLTRVERSRGAGSGENRRVQSAMNEYFLRGNPGVQLK